MRSRLHACAVGVGAGGEAWREAQAIAKAVIVGTAHLPDFKALYFHNLTVKPRWNQTKELVARIGNHIFYA